MTGRAKPPARPERIVLRDPRAIKALAHPARLAVLDELMAGRELTATDAAAVAGMSPSAMSYHLRELAKWSIIRPAVSGDGRERRWRMAEGGFAIEPDQPQTAAAAGATLTARMLDRQREDVLDWFAHQDREQEWQQGTTIAISRLWLTAPEAEALSQALLAAVERLPHRTREDHPAAARAVSIGVVVVPEKDR